MSILIKNTSHVKDTIIAGLIVVFEREIKNKSSATQIQNLIELYKLKYNVHFKITIFDDLRIYYIIDANSKDYDKLDDLINKMVNYKF